MDFLSGIQRDPMASKDPFPPTRAKDLWARAMGAPLKVSGRDQDGLKGSSLDPGRAAQP